MNPGEVLSFRSHMERSKKKNGESHSKKYINNLIFYVEKMPDDINIDSFNRFTEERNLHPNTVRGLTNVLRWKGIDERDIAFDVKIPPKKKPRHIKEDKFLSIDECRRLIAESDDPLFILYVRIAWDTWARVSEVINLTRQDIRGNIIIFRRIKGGKSGTGIIKPSTMKYINDYIRDNDISKELFVRKGEQLNERKMRYIIKKNVLSILNREFTPHWFRNAGSQWAKWRGASDTDIKAGGRWKSEAYKGYIDEQNMEIRMKSFAKFNEEL